MSNKKELEAQFGSPDRPLTIGGIEIPCYVLNDSKRVITQTGFLKAIGLQYRGASSEAAPPARIAQFATGKRISPFITKELLDLTTNPIIFKTHTGSSAYGYEATILVDLCNAILEAKKQGALQKQQYHLAENAETLVRAFAKTGIIALIDEVTGYQKVREKDDLQKFLKKFLLEEHAKWVKTFPDDFFEMIFKMKGWTWYYAGQTKPSVVGHYINDFVYSRIAPSVLTELKRLNPVSEKGFRKHKHAQFINKDYGHPKLKEHLMALVALGKASGHNWNNFKRMVERAFPKYGDTLEIPYKDEDQN